MGSDPPDTTATTATSGSDELPGADGGSSPPSCRTAARSTRSSSTRRRTSPTSGGRRCCGRCGTRRRAGCTSTPTRTSASSRGSASPPVPLVPLVLDHNLRNTKQIARGVRPAGADADDLARRRGRRGALRPAAADDARRRRPTTQVERAARGGLGPEHIALLTTGPRHPVQVERARTAHGQARLLATVTGTTTTSSTATSWAARASSDGPSCCASTPRRPRGPRRSSTSGCPGPPTSWSWSATRA